MTDDIRIFCVVDGESPSNAFSVEIASTKTVDVLKDLIKAKKSPKLDDIAADELTLWRVSIPVNKDNKRDDDDDDDDHNDLILLGSLSKEEKNKLRATDDVSDVFEGTPPGKNICIIVQRPPPVHTPTPARASDESCSSSPRSDDLSSRIEAIEDKFFADNSSGSSVSSFLKDYVEGKKELPFTKDGIKGLPLVKRRGAGKEAKPELSLLFLDLPKPPSNPGDAIDERFQSNPVLKELDELETQDLPVFGVSGCGKTRSVIEVLCLQWGFYFNASQTDLGSDDLYNFIEFIDDETSALEEDISTNTLVATNIAQLLFLSRLMVLKHCLSVPGCRETFSSASWALLQVCPNTFRDVFWELFWEFYINIDNHMLLDSSLELIVKQEFESVRDMLIKLKYPNFSSESKFRLVIDEAQLLADMKSNSFESSSNSGIRRPMLSPILHGFRTPGNKDKLTVIYCGTGLSVKPLDLVRGSGDDVKGGVPTKDFKYIEFPGWDDVNSVQAYVNRIKNALSNKKLKRKVDGLIPQEAVEELHEQLTGRFRPIVTAIEIILKEDEEWDSAIDEVEGILTSWWEREKKGNLCGELDRLEAKIAKYLEDFPGCLTIKEALGLFLSHYYRLGDPSLVLEYTNAWLVEIGFGHIKFFNGVARTVLDEPFVLKATENYFQVKDPLLISQAKQGMLQSNNPTVHGIMWETMMPSIFVKTFEVRKTRKLSSWPLPTKVPFPRELNGNVTIVGYEQGRTLTVSHKHLTIQQFMKAHVENGSKQDGPYIPPFYFPAPHVTGPDIIFFVKIKNKIYPCFVQLKLRQKFEKDDVEKAHETVSSEIIQEKMNNEHEKQQESTTSASSDQQQPRLQDYCPNGKYISMVIVYPAKAKDDNFCGVQIDSNPGPDGLERVSINIDGSNFSKIFPPRHAKFLDILKKCSENQLPQQSKLNKLLHWTFGMKGVICL